VVIKNAQNEQYKVPSMPSRCAKGQLYLSLVTVIQRPRKFNI